MWLMGKEAMCRYCERLVESGDELLANESAQRSLLPGSVIGGRLRIGGGVHPVATRGGSSIPLQLKGGS
jgi:hypothetical protein